MFKIKMYEAFSSPTRSTMQSTACAFCEVPAPRYVCPRCHAPYCSLRCYRGPAHTACSETFYETEVRRELEERSGGDEDTKRRMLEALKRTQVRSD